MQQAQAHQCTTASSSPMPMTVAVAVTGTPATADVVATQSVAADLASRVLAQSPTVLVTAFDAQANRTTFMAAQWTTPVAKDRIAVVLGSASHTLKCIRDTKQLVINVPPASALASVVAAGSCSGSATDKMALPDTLPQLGAARPCTWLPGSPALLLSKSLASIEMALETDLEVPGASGTVMIIGHSAGCHVDPTLFRESRWNLKSDDDHQTTLAHLGAHNFVKHIPMGH
ncbi:hypothetical protein Pelo_15077 [Pelomyxa schiedti]|nr:hypothetical protein Pelo_15077 [Pelomyxa schiedti]